MKTRVTIVGLLCGALLWGCHSDPKSGKPEPGTELYAVAPESVREIVISLPLHKIYAYRWATDQPFQLVVASRAAAQAEQCSGGAGFQRLLQTLATMPIIKESEKHFEEDTEAWADVQLRDTTQLDPIAARIRIPQEKSEPVVIQFGDRQYLVQMDAQALRASQSGCAELAGY